MRCVKTNDLKLGKINSLSVAKRMDIMIKSWDSCLTGSAAGWPLAGAEGDEGSGR